MKNEARDSARTRPQKGERQIVFLNGRFVPEDEAVLPVFDRGFLYGDGLFETLLVFNGKPFRWSQHMERLGRGAAFLRIAMPYSPETLGEFAARLVERNRTTDAVLRINLSRGVGPRGYSPAGASRPNLVMTLHPAPPVDLANPPVWRLATSPFRVVAGDPLAQFKTSNKLPQVLARAAAEAAGADEALLLDTSGHVASAAGGNFFWIEKRAVCTPPVGCGILPGVTRAVVCEPCIQLGIAVREKEITLDHLRKQAGVFLTLSTFGIVEVDAIDNQSLRRSKLVARIRERYWRLVRDECGNRETAASQQKNPSQGRDGL